MSARLRALYEKRNNVVQLGRDILNKAAEENRSLTAEEQTNFDKSFTDQEAIQKDIEREERQARVEAELAGRLGDQVGGGGDHRHGGGGSENTALQYLGEGRYRVALEGLSDHELRSVRHLASKEYRAGWGHYIRTGERRALDAGSTGSNGGYLITPLQIMQGLLQKLDDAVFMRARGTVFNVPNATSLGRVSLDEDVEDGDWTPELAVGNEEDSMAFGRRELTPHALAKHAKVSNKLVRISSFDIVGLLLQRLAYKFGVTEEKQFLIGDGNRKPLGVYFPHQDGVPTSRDMATGNTSTAMTFDGLINAKYHLKDGYHKNAAWNFHRLGVAQVAKLRDDSGASPGTGQYLWQPSTQLGQPDKLLNIPLITSEFTPSVFTTGKYVGMLADWSYYYIADALDAQTQRLNELYALKNQTGLIMRKETDGMPALAEAFVRIKLG